MQLRELNWPGLLSGASLMTLLLISIAWRSPWWTMNIGEGLGYVNLSPFDTDIQVLGTTLEVPIVTYLNIAAKITSFLAAVTMLYCSLSTAKSYSEKLLDLSYRKPIYMTILIIVLGAAFRLFLGSASPLDLPLTGASTLHLTSKGVSLSVPVSTSFTRFFWLAVLSASLAAAAKIYHTRFLRKIGSARDSSAKSLPG